MKGKIFATRYISLRDHAYNLELCKDLLKAQDDEFLTQEALKAIDKKQSKIKRKLYMLGEMEVK